MYAVSKNGGLKEIASVMADGAQIFENRKPGNLPLAGSAAVKRNERKT